VLGNPDETRIAFQVEVEWLDKIVVETGPSTAFGASNVTQIDRLIPRVSLVGDPTTVATIGPEVTRYVITCEPTAVVGTSEIMVFPSVAGVYAIGSY
jgi:hypothetical protein